MVFGSVGSLVVTGAGPEPHNPNLPLRSHSVNWALDSSAQEESLLTPCVDSPTHAWCALYWSSVQDMQGTDLFEWVIRQVLQPLSLTYPSESRPSPEQRRLAEFMAGGWQLTHTVNPSLRYCIHRVRGRFSLAQWWVSDSVLNSMQYLEQKKKFHVLSKGLSPTESFRKPVVPKDAWPPGAGRAAQVPH